MGKIYLTNSKYDAKYKVFFCNSKFDERNTQILKGCTLSNSPYGPGVIKVWITNSKYDADIIITRQNFPTK